MSHLEPANDLAVVLCTAPSEEVARALARGLVERRLAACVNLAPLLASVYSWEGAVHAEPEVLLVVKTSRAGLDALAEHLLEEHPYDVPELLVLGPEAASAVYAAWVRSSVG